VWPLSVADPLAFGAGVNVSLPLGSTAGAPVAVNRAGLVVLTAKLTVCQASSARPALMPGAHWAIDCGPASSATCGSTPFENRGASLTGRIAIVKVCAGLVSTPAPRGAPSCWPGTAIVAPPALRGPPASCARTASVATPLASGAGVNVSVPVAETAGCAEKSAGLSTETWKSTVWPASPGAPGLIDVAHPAIDRAGASSKTVWSGPLTKLGGRLPTLTPIATFAADVKSPSVAM